MVQLRSRAARSVCRTSLVLSLILPLPAVALAGAEVGARAAVSIAGTEVLTLGVAAGGNSPVERATLANAMLQELLGDPDCGPEQLARQETPEGVLITLCDVRILLVTDADAAAEGLAREVLTDQWSQRLVSAFGERKQALYGSRLLRAAIVGLLLPLAFLLALVLVHFSIKRLEAWLVREARSHHGETGAGAILASPAVRQALRQTATIVKWALYLLLTYVFILVFLRQFPGSAAWAAALLRPLDELMRGLGPGLVTLLPRLLAAALLLIVTRLLLNLSARLFDNVREGRVNLEPLLSAETAGPAEVTVRVLLSTLALLLLVMLIPGQTWNLSLVLAALLGLALVIGGRDAIASLLGGLLILYSRPFRTGDRVRLDGVDAEVVRKGSLLTRLRISHGHELLMPNARILARPLEVLSAGHPLAVRAVFEGSPAAEALPELLQRTLLEIGGSEGASRALLVEIAEGKLVFDLEWTAPRGEYEGLARDRLLRALRRIASERGLRVISASPIRWDAK